MRCRHSAGAAAVAYALGLAGAFPADAQPSIGNEFQANTYTLNDQGRPAVAEAAAGSFVAVWHSQGSAGSDTSAESIQGQRYAKNGATVGAQFQINSYTTSYQFSPSVSSEADGDFVVVWESVGSDGSDTTNYSIQGQRIKSNGAFQGSQFQVNAYATGNQFFPSVASDADGDFVVVWASHGSPGTDSSYDSIQGQRYSSLGAPAGAQFQVNTYTTSAQSYPSVAISVVGDFVVVWSSLGSPGTDSNYNSIQGQRYASSGSAQGAQFQVNAYTTGYQDFPTVASAANGAFIVVWQSFGSSGTDTSGISIQGQRFASSGALQGAQFQVNTFTTGYQFNPVVAADEDGDFVVAWDGYGSVGTDSDNSSVQGQRYASNGTLQGTQFQINTYTTGFQRRPAVAADQDRNFVVVWHSAGSSGSDTSDGSILGQLFGTRTIAVPSLSPAGVLAVTAALLLFGVTYALRRRA